MRKTRKLFAVVFWVILGINIFIQVEAMMLAPLFNVEVIVNSVGGDANFGYRLESHSANSPVINDQQNFSVITESGEGSYLSGVIAGNGDDVYLTQNLPPDWEVVSVNCNSSNPDISSNIIEVDKIKIKAHPYSSITCTFNNSKIIKKTPVIIIPGILSSTLKRNDDSKTELWPNIIKILFGLPGDKYLDELSLNQIGQPNLSYPVVLPTDIFRKIQDKDFFDGLVKFLQTLGYVEGKDLFVFPYDWRLDIRDSVDNLYSPILTNLKDRIEQIRTQTGSTKIDIVAHSMGGLLAKYYIKHYGMEKVDKFVDIATPHLGAPSAFKTLMYGDDLGIKFGFLGLNSAEIKKISQNMISAYQLLPSLNYFSATSSDYRYYVYDLDDIDKNGVRGRLNFEQTSQLLKNTGRNDYLLDTATNIHSDLDFMNPADYGALAYNIVGCGIPTIGKFFTLGSKYKNQYYDVAYISGDGTVPERSSRSFPAIQEYQVTGVNHSGLPSSEGVRDLVSKILTNSTSTFDFITYEYISTSTPVCKLPNGELLSFHGPVKVNTYDTNQNHAGPIEGSDGYEQNLPGVTYDYIENNTFVFLPLLPQSNSYQVKIVAKRRGSASVHVKKIQDNKVTQTEYFADIPLSSASTTLNLENQNNGSVINIDQSGDGINVETITPSSTLNGDSLEDLEPPVTTIHLEQATTTATTTVTFTTDGDDTLKTDYSTDGGETYHQATSTVEFSEVGTTTIIYQSTDTAGNIENPQSVDIFISEPVSTSTTITSIEVGTSTAMTAKYESPSTPGHTRHVDNKISMIGMPIYTNLINNSEVPPPDFSKEVVTEILTQTTALDNKKEESVPGNSSSTEIIPISQYYASAAASTSRLNDFIWLILILLLLLWLLLFLGKKSLKR